MYDYKKAIKDDILELISEREIKELSERDKEDLYDELWASDYVTGNASGSYYCNAWDAEEALCHNLDLLEEATYDFGVHLGEAVRKGAEYCDVVIRCYLLRSALEEVLEENAA